MKKLLGLIILIMIILSCQKEFLGGDVDILPLKDTTCITCPYFPSCDSSIYTYSDSTTGAPATRIDTIFFRKDTVINGLSYRKVYLTGRKQTSFVNCSNGDTRQIVTDTVQIGTFSASNVRLILLKANLPVGGTWTDTITLSNGQTALFKNKIVAKSISRSINSIVYPDVIHTQTDIGINLPFIGFSVLAKSNTYFAKKVGIIETDIVNAITSEKIIHSVLLKSVIP